MIQSPLTPESQNDQLNTSSVQSNLLDDIIVYTCNSIKNSNVRPVKLSNIVAQIKNPPSSLLKVYNEIRKIKDTAQRQEKKKQFIPYFCFQTFKGNKRKNTQFITTKFIVMDLDHLGSKLPEIKAQVVQDQEAFLAFTSPSGDGLKVAYELEKAATSEIEFRKAFAYLKEMLETKYRVKVDKDADPARACFLGYDPDLLINVNRVPQVIPANQSPASSTSNVLQALSGSSSPGRTDAMASIIGQLNQRGIDKEIALGLVHAWNKQNNNPPLPDQKVIDTVNYMYAEYKSQSSMRPASLVIKDNCYYLVRGEEKQTSKKILSNFIITPKELLILDSSDCLVCDIATNQNTIYRNVKIENNDWHTKTRLLKAIGHQDCSFFGSDNDVQSLCNHINMNMPLRKSGTKVIGLVDNVWVTEGINITASGKSQNISLVPYQKGTDAFYRGIGYSVLDDETYQSTMMDFYENITKINNVETIMPILGWNFAAPLKPIIMKMKKSFPLMFVHGSQGSGKSSTAKLFMRMHGYKDDKPQMCDLKPFPLLKLLSSTNAIPVFLDEFKVKDMRQESVDNLLRFMRKSYDGEVETKGRQDQTVESYELQAPMVVMGEWSINQPAIKERIIFPRFSNVMKKTPNMQKAFQMVVDLPLEAIMPRYIEFVLNQDIEGLYNVSNRFVLGQLKSKIVSPRIVHNLSVMIVGLLLFLKYGKHLGVQLPRIKFKAVIMSQLKEITGTDSGMVRSAVDQLIEELGFMAQKNEKERAYLVGGYSTEIVKTPWFTTATVGNIKCLAIRFSKVFPEFKIYAKQTNYEGDLLDKESYMKMFDECEYLVNKSHPVDYDSKKYKSLCINIEKAKTAGIDLEGFGIE